MPSFRRLLLCVIAAALCGAGCEKDPTRPARHVVVIGVDAVTWNALDPLLARGLLPSLAWLRDHGAAGTLHSDLNAQPPAIWTTVATGKGAQKHAVASFVQPLHAGEAAAPVTSTMRRAKTFWDILGQGGFDVAIVAWPVSWPVEAVNGRMISDRAHLGAHDDKSAYPPAYLADVATPNVSEAAAAIDGLAGSERLMRAWLHDKYYLRATERILDDGPLPRVLAMHLRGPLPVSNASPETVERYWIWTDAALGRVLDDYLDSSRLVVIVSGSPGSDGIFIAEGPGVRVGAKLARVTHADVTPTLLYYLGSPVGADMDGRVIDGLFTGTAAAAQPASVPSYEARSPAPPSAPLSDPSDAAVLEELRALGYLD